MKTYRNTLLFGLVVMTMLAACSPIESPTATLDPKAAAAGTATTIARADELTAYPTNVAVELNKLRGTLVPTQGTPTAPQTQAPPAAQSTATTTSSAITSTKVITSTGETFTWIWSSAGGINTQDTPKLVDNGSFSTGNGKEASYDIGVKSDQFALVKGKKISYNGVTSGDNVMCGLLGFGPGYHYNVIGFDARYEVYDLPTGGNWKEWAQVLIDQASKVDQKEYGCPATALKDVTVFFNKESAPFNAIALSPTKK